MTNQQALVKYLLKLGDNALIQGHRLSEWCSRGPILEEDIALSNLALDNIGRAQAFLQYAAIVEGNGRTDDDLAYKRSERQFFNHLITELPIGNFGFTIAKQLLITGYELLLFEALCHSTDSTIAAISAKTLKEVKYHWSHASDWCLRLGLGTEESHNKLQTAINDLWAYTGEMFVLDENDNTLIAQGIAVDVSALKDKWLEKVNGILGRAGISLPTETYMQVGSAKGIHTEYLGHILSEMQYLQRAYPDAKW